MQRFSSSTLHVTLSAYERLVENLNFHCGTDSLKHAVLMYTRMYHDGRSTVEPHDRYALRLRLHQTTISKLLFTAALTPLNRRYVDYSFCVKAELNLLLDGGLYSFAAIRWCHSFYDHTSIRASLHYSRG